MSPAQVKIAESEFLSHKPLFEDQAEEIMLFLASLTSYELAQNLGISNQLAVKAHNLAYDFPHKIMGYEAIQGFIGEAYRGLDISTLAPQIIKEASDKVRIISSIYGILAPTDIIKPYRCEYNKHVNLDHKTPIQIYKPKITTSFVNFIKEKKIEDVINLLPADADKCLDWKIIRAFTKVHKIVFQTITPEGKLKTPIAKRLKELRGIMCRTILEHNIKSFEELTKVKSEHFIFSPADSKPLLPVFISD